jgi:hypothetical protein
LARRIAATLAIEGGNLPALALRRALVAVLPFATAAVVCLVAHALLSEYAPEAQVASVASYRDYDLMTIGHDRSTIRDELYVRSRERFMLLTGRVDLAGWDAAIREADSVQHRPLRSAALAALAKRSAREGDFEQALRLVEMLGGESGKSLGTLQDVAEELARLGQFTPALEVARKIGDGSPRRVIYRDVALSQIAAAMLHRPSSPPGITRPARRRRRARQAGRVRPDAGEHCGQHPGRVALHQPTSSNPIRPQLLGDPVD